MIDDYFSTADLPTSSLLFAIGFPLIKLEKINHNKFNFVFEKTNSLENTVQSFQCGEEMFIVPNNLLNAHKHLKQLLWTQKQQC
jgi:hypothetical protein